MQALDAEEEDEEMEGGLGIEAWLHQVEQSLVCHANLLVLTPLLTKQAGQDYFSYESFTIISDHEVSRHLFYDGYNEIGYRL